MLYLSYCPTATPRNKEGNKQQFILIAKPVFSELKRFPISILPLTVPNTYYLNPYNILAVFTQLKAQ